MSPSSTGPSSQAEQGTPGLPPLLYQSVPLGRASVQQPQCSSLWTLGHYTGFAEEHRDRPGHLLPSSLDL